MKTLHMILVSGLLASSVQPALKSNDFFQENGVLATLGIGAAAVATAIGGAFFINWLVTPTDEQLIVNAESALSEYRYDLQSISARIGAPCEYNNHALMFDNLQTITQWLASRDISTLSSQISQTMNSFDGYIKDMSKRAAKLQTNQEYSAAKQATIDRFNSLISAMKQAKISLSKAHRFVKEHTAYFDLLTVVNTIYKKFEYEYSLAYYSSPLAIQVITKSPLFTRNYKYPIHAYLNDMESIVGKLKSAGSNICFEWIPVYGNLYDTYRRLDAYFTAIISEVKTSDLFRQERYFKLQQEMLERQLEIERALKQIEQQKLYAMQQHNYELQKQNELKERELQLQRERLIAELHALHNNITITIQ